MVGTHCDEFSIRKSLVDFEEIDVVCELLVKELDVATVDVFAAFARTADFLNEEICRRDKGERPIMWTNCDSVVGSRNAAGTHEDVDTDSCPPNCTYLETNYYTLS